LATDGNHLIDCFLVLPAFRAESGFKIKHPSQSPASTFNRWRLTVSLPAISRVGRHLSKPLGDDGHVKNELVVDRPGS